MVLEKGYSYNDITLVPTVISDIKSRKECDPYTNDKMLPIFASCMSTVVSEDNYDEFKQNKITPIIPRNINFQNRIGLMYKGEWIAMSMSEFEAYFITDLPDTLIECNNELKVCIDVANGHMKCIYELAITAKEIATKYSYTLTIMTGNIANPTTYEWICDNAIYHYHDEDGIEKTGTAIDYIRISIGTGSQCTTSSNTSIHYPIASLIDGCRIIKNAHEHKWQYYPNHINYRPLPMIVADGGIRNYNDIIKALALGADYVMIGGLFAGMYESAAPLLIQQINQVAGISYPTYKEVDYKYTSEEKKRTDINNRTLYKECYGMSTKRAQELIDPEKAKKTAEGKHSIISVKYTIKQWAENMIDYLKSAMSYCGAHDLNEFIGKPQLIVNSPGTMISVNK